MAQGKLKVKTKLPHSTKPKKQKGKASTQRSNRPIQPKKKKQEEVKQLKQNISKAVNKSAEEEIRALASNGQKFSKAQQAVADYHQSKKSLPIGK